VVPLGIVPVDKGTDDPFCLSQVLEPVVPDALSLERTNNPFCYGIALRIAHIGIGKLEPEPFRVMHKEIGGILRTMIKFQVNTGNSILLKSTESIDRCHLQGIEGSSCRIFLRYPVADDFPVMVINDGKEPAPAILFSPELGPVAYLTRASLRSPHGDHGARDDGESRIATRVVA